MLTRMSAPARRTRCLRPITAPVNMDTLGGWQGKRSSGLLSSTAEAGAFRAWVEGWVEW